MQKTIELFKRIAKRALEPVRIMTVSEWADENRVLSSKSSSEPGRWRTSRAPYQKAIMDCFTDYEVEKVVVKSCSQIGKSDIMNNVIGRFAHLDPGPILMIQPTIDMAEDYSKRRIAPMIDETKCLTELFGDPKTRKSDNTILSKDFPGGYLVMGGANSPAGLASRPIRILLADEVDRFPKSAGTEGDPVGLAAKRTSNFHNRKIGLFSTPTIKGASRIDDEYLEGTQEEWQHECPNCKEYHLLRYPQMVTEHEASFDHMKRRHVVVKSLKWRCPDCGFSFTEQEMRQTNQKYVMHNPIGLEKNTRSFFVNCFASPWVSWKTVMQEWLEARGDTDLEKVVYNTRFGESYERLGNFESEDVFMNRREDYGAELPEGVLILTAAVDTQDNRLEYEICGWGIGEERWGINKGIILGTPDGSEVWNLLDEVLDREYYFKNGRSLRVYRTFLDTGGHYSKEVGAYCLKNKYKQRIGIKGSSVPGESVVSKVGKLKTLYGTIPLQFIGTDSAKTYIMDRLSITESGPKCMHFPFSTEGDNENTLLANRGYDEIYFRGLIAEELVPEKHHGQIVWKWKNIAKDGRNEPLDLAVYNLACVQSCKIDWAKLDAAFKLSSGKIALDTKKRPRLINKAKKKYGTINAGVRGD